MTISEAKKGAKKTLQQKIKEREEREKREMEIRELTPEQRRAQLKKEQDESELLGAMEFVDVKDPEEWVRFEKTVIEIELFQYRHFKVRAEEQARFFAVLWKAGKNNQPVFVESVLRRFRRRSDASADPGDETRRYEKGRNHAQGPNQQTRQRKLRQKGKGKNDFHGRIRNIYFENRSFFGKPKE